jgi:hypothetical protein
MKQPQQAARYQYFHRGEDVKVAENKPITLTTSPGGDFRTPMQSIEAFFHQNVAGLREALLIKGIT